MSLFYGDIPAYDAENNQGCMRGQGFAVKCLVVPSVNLNWVRLLQAAYLVYHTCMRILIGYNRLIRLDGAELVRLIAKLDVKKDIYAVVTSVLLAGAALI